MEENQAHIPEGWKLNKLGSVCRIKKGVQFNKVDLSNSGMYPCINGGIEPSGYSELWNTNENTITISEGGNSCGYVNFLSTKFWSGGHCYSLLDLDKKLENDFLYQALKGRQSLIMDLRVGSGLPNIQQKAIKEFEFLSPENKPEQTQIANILLKVDKSITQTEQLIAKYTRIKTGLMQDLLTKGIDENGNIRSEVTHEFKDSPLGRIPKEWEVKSLNSITKDDICYGIVQVGKNVFGGVKTIAIKDLNTNYEDVHLTESIIEKRYLRSRITGGEVLLSIKATTDKVDIVPQNFQGNISRDIAKLSFKDECIPLFYKYYFLAEAGRKALDLITIGTTRKEISIAPLKKVEVLKPSKNEQQRILNAISSSDENIKIKCLQLSKLQSIKTGLMQDLLSGKVRVNHLIKETASV